MPTELTADAGYGSEENYEYAQKNGIEAYVKYNTFDKEDTSKWKKDIRRQENMYYNEDKDCFYCPMGQPMEKIGEEKKKTKRGYEQTITRYQAKNCSLCPMRGACYKSVGDRVIEVNHNLRNHKSKVKKLLNSPEGLERRKKRSVEPDGNIKQNKKFRRFMLRGLDKVKIETYLLSIAHNFTKMAIQSA